MAFSYTSLIDDKSSLDTALLHSGKGKSAGLELAMGKKSEAEAEAMKPAQLLGEGLGVGDNTRVGFDVGDNVPVGLGVTCGVGAKFGAGEGVAYAEDEVVTVEINVGDGEVAEGTKEGDIDGIGEDFGEGREMFCTTKNAMISITTSKTTTITTCLLLLKTCILIQK